VRPLTPLINIDLHCHSTFSDGVLPPDQLIARARERRVEVLALTDHDETGGLKAAHVAADECGIVLIDGVEISVTWREQTLHILGLGVDTANEPLRTGLALTREGRTERAKRIAAVLERFGIHGSFEGARRFADNPHIVGRTHFARFLVEQGIVKDLHAAFKRYLGDGRPGHVSHRWASLIEAVGWIKASGGAAVVAHPGRYRLDTQMMKELLGEFRDCGGDAIEVVSGSHSPQQYVTFAEFARGFGLAASCGSDFHSPHESRHDLGGLPELPPGCVPVWEKSNLVDRALANRAITH
jgi:hypothetical protein